MAKVATARAIDSGAFQRPATRETKILHETHLSVSIRLLWSTGFIGARFGLPFSEPLSFLLIRYLCVIVLMTTIAVLSRAPWPQQPSQWWHIGISGLLIHAIYLGAYFYRSSTVCRRVSARWWSACSRC